MKIYKIALVLGIAAGVLSYGQNWSWAGGTDPYGNDDPNRQVVKRGLLGAGTGAIAAGASGGKAGQGALIGAGTNVIGGALLDTLSQPTPRYAPQYAQPQYAPPPQQYAPPPQQQGYYQQPQQGYYQEPPPVQPVYAQPQYAPPPQEDPNKKILKQGLLGAGTGAIAASASGGKAGKGALIGAGTNIIGGALLDTLTAPSPQPQQAYYPPPPQQGYYQQQPAQQQPQKRIIRKYDAEGNVISEEEVYQ